MRLHKYKGKKPQNLSRYGEVTKGDKVPLTEEESYYVRDNPEWSLVDDPTEKEGFPEELPDPINGKYFPLLSIPWRSKNVFRFFYKSRRVHLIKISMQMEAVGLPVPSTDRTDTSTLREELLRICRIAGWL